MTPQPKSVQPTTLALIGANCFAGVLAGPASAAIGEINSLVIEERRFNDFPGTTLTVTDNDFAGVRIQETDFIPDGGNDFANRHVAWLSDNNVDRFAFQNGEGFEFFADINLDWGADTTIKEAGIYMDSLIAGEGQFLLKGGGNNEIATFGSFFPFTSSTADDDDGVEYNGQTYNKDTTVNIGLRYTPGSGPSAEPGVIEPDVRATMEFFVDGVSSGARDITNNENGVIDGSQFGFYVQTPGDFFASPPDFSDVLFSNVVFNVLGGDVITGDYDTSGQVEQGDLDIVLQNWGTGTFTGDENALVGGGPFDGTVDQNELDGVLQNWGSVATPDFTGSAVPEPAALALLGVGGLAALRRRIA